MKEVIVNIKDQERLVLVKPDETILEASLRSGLKLIHSCKKGQCGSCRAIVEAGEVDMRNNFSLFEEEVKAGQVLLCQSYPLTDQIIIRPIHVPRL